MRDAPDLRLETSDFFLPFVTEEISLQRVDSVMNDPVNRRAIRTANGNLDLHAPYRCYPGQFEGNRFSVWQQPGAFNLERFFAGSGRAILFRPNEPPR